MNKMKVEPLEPKTEELIRKNKRGKYLLDDSENKSRPYTSVVIAFDLPYACMFVKY